MKYAAACAHVKNEQDIITEWMAFHLSVGFEHLFIIDNGSSDSTRHLIQNFSASDRVTYMFQPTGVPADFSTIFLKNFGDQFRWMAFIDADEFLYPSRGGDIRMVLTNYEDSSAVGVYWQLYGSNGLEDRPDGLVAENFVKRAPSDYYLHRHVKSIVNPRKVIGPVGSHVFKVDGAFVDEQHRRLHDREPFGYFEDMEPSHDILRINHYHVLSRKQYEQKKLRGYFGINDEKLQVDDNFRMMWELHDRNDIFDDSAAAYSRLVKFYIERSSSV